MYGKLIDGVLINAPLRLAVGGRVYYNPTNEKYEQAGYKKIVYTPYPEIVEGEEKYYKSSYEEQDDKIVKVWNETEPPVEPEPQPTEIDLIKLTQTELNNNQEQLRADVDYIAIMAGVDLI